MNFSIDSCVWLVVIVFMIISTFSWLSLRNYENEFDYQKKVFFISEMLVSTPGIPENWNRDYVEQVGLLGKYHNYYKKCHLDISKINELMSMNYEKLKQLLKVENVKIKFAGLEIGESKQRAKITRHCKCGGIACEIEIEM